MTLENEPVFSHPSPPRKPYNPFGSDDDLLNGPTSKSEKKLAKDNPIGFGLGGFDQSVATLPFHMNNGDFQWEGTILVHPPTGVDSVLRVDGSTEMGLFGKGMEFYTDENAMECEMPGFIVCIKESSYHSVKDICIDAGVPSQGKIWVQTREDIEKDPSAVVDLGPDIDSDLDMGRDSEPPSLGGVKSSKSNDSLAKVSVEMYEVKDSPECLADDLPNAIGGSIPGSRCLAAGETEADGLACAAAEGNYLGENVLDKERSLNASYTDLTSGESLKDGPAVNEGHEVCGKWSADDTLEIQTSSPQLSSIKPPVLDDAEAEFNSEESPVDHVVRLSPSSEPYDGSHRGGGYTDSGSVTIVVNPVIPKEEQEECGCANEKPPKSRSTSGDTEGSSGNVRYLTLHQHFLEEKSFSSGIHQPSPITYLEPIGYSGNISLRSESSAGSTRSFAFPVLQTEWYGSPARMAKAGQERSQKLWGWLQAIICCRF